jgi:hypothetical protein
MGEQMLTEWVAVEHYRLHQVESWPDSPRRRAALSAIHSTLQSLSRDPRFSAEALKCAACARAKSTPIEITPALHVVRNVADLAA